VSRARPKGSARFAEANSFARPASTRAKLCAGTILASFEIQGGAMLRPYRAARMRFALP
jgi:hypothetical protein